MTRLTLRKQILNLLAEHHLLTAPDILQKLEDVDHPYNKTSVYRAIDKLLNDDQICRLSFGTNEILYELRNHHHDHLVCSNCGSVEAAHCHVEYGELGGFKPDHHQISNSYFEDH